jgi:tetratricopeptide (TPR) repeat protein
MVVVTSLTRSETDDQRAAKVLALVEGADLLVAAGDREDALAAYRKALATYKMLVAADPSNIRWQNNLVVCLAITRKLAAADPGGDHEGALAEYRALFALFKELAADDPGNAEGRRDLAISHESIGDVLAAAGAAKAAIVEYRIPRALYKTGGDEHRISGKINKNSELLRQNPDLVSEQDVQNSSPMPWETFTPAGERGSPRLRHSSPLPEARHEVTRPAAETPSLEWPAAGWQKLREEGGVRRHHAIIEYLVDTWKPFLDATGAAVTLEILEQKDPGAGSALRRYLERHPMPEELKFVPHDEVMRILAERPTRLVDTASCRMYIPDMS